MSDSDASVRIRSATVGDAAVLAKLFDQYRVFYRQPSDIAGSEAFLRERLRYQQSWMLVAQVDGQAAGFAQLYPLFSSVSAHPLMVLNDLFVAEPMRNSGIGKRLILASQSLARALGYRTMTIATEKTNKRARSMYPKMGFCEETGFVHYTMQLTKD